MMRADRRRGGSSRRCDVRLSSVRGSNSSDRRMGTARSSCDPIPSGYEYPQLRHSAEAVPNASEMARRAPRRRARAARRRAAPLTIAEIWRGILQKPEGQKRRELEEWFSGPEGPLKLFEGRILPFDEDAAMIWARLMAEGKARGRPRSALDMIVAAVANANHCVVATANVRDFEGLPFFDPT